MEIAITTMSRNGQIVIPSEIRRAASIGPATKFIVFNKNGNVMLKQIKSEALEEEMKLMEQIYKSEKEITEGKYTEVDSRMSAEEIDTMLMK